MPMVDIVDHQVLHNAVDLSQIDHHARVQIHRTANGHRKLVVVAVVPGTCPEYLAIAGLVPIRLRLAGSATAWMMLLGCQPSTWLRSPPVNARRPPSATRRLPSGSVVLCSGRWYMNSNRSSGTPSARPSPFIRESLRSSRSRDGAFSRWPRAAAASPCTSAPERLSSSA